MSNQHTTTLEDRLKLISVINPSKHISSWQKHRPFYTKTAEQLPAWKREKDWSVATIEDFISKCLLLLVTITQNITCINLNWKNIHKRNLLCIYKLTQREKKTEPCVNYKVKEEKIELLFKMKINQNGKFPIRICDCLSNYKDF